MQQYGHNCCLPPAIVVALLQCQETAHAYRRDASHNVLIEVHHFIGETRHLTSTRGMAAERACGADVIITGQSAATILT